MPSRDAATHLPQAIRSLQLQTFRDFEVVALNDGSRDATGEMLEHWAEEDERVRVVHLDGIGLVEALRVGCELCAGELIARADADDVAHPRRFAEQIGLLSARPELVAVGTRVRYFPWDRVGWGARRYQGWLNGLTEPENLALDIFVECPIAHPTLMIRRAELAHVGGYRPNGWPEDYDLILRLHTAGARLANVARVLHFWRERDGRASRRDPRYSADAFRRCKIHFLRLGCLRSHESVGIWGAGQVGKAFARSLAEHGIRVREFFDIDPRKIGQQILGAPVRDAREVGETGGAYLLVAVGSNGARELIRAQLAELGMREPRDYRCVA